MLFRGSCRILIRLAWLALGIGAATTPGAALEPATPLARLNHQFWTMENGLPQNTVPVLFQSREGYLWAGTELGLARYDGASFRLFDRATLPQFPDAEIRCLLDDPAGTGLWIGTSDGLALWSAGKLRVFTSKDGLPGNSVRGLAATSDGVWVWTDAGLARSTGDRTGQSFVRPPAQGFPGGEITSIAADAAGGVWIGTSRGAALIRGGAWIAGPGKAGLRQAALVRSAAGGDVLIASAGGVYVEHNGAISGPVQGAVLPPAGVSFLARLTDGTLAAADKASLALARDGATERFEVGRQLPGSRIESMMTDRSGSLWVGTNRGLARISRQGAAGHFVVDKFPPSDPLAVNSVVSILEDLEGNLWAGTETGGLHILRDTRFRPVGSPEGMSSDNTTAIVEDTAKRTWVGTADAGLNRVTSDAAGNLTFAGFTAANGLMSNVILSLAAGTDGDVWVGTPDGLTHIGRGGTTSYTSADGLPDDFIRSLLAEPDGSLWIGTRRGLTHLQHGKFSTMTEADGLGSDLVGALIRTADGDLWIATFHGVSRLHNGQLRNYTTTDGLSSNVITALSLDPTGRIWVGTQNSGLNLWDGQRFMAVRSSSTDLPAVIHSIALDTRDHLWLASENGLVRADAPYLADCAEKGVCSELARHVQQFTTADGLRGRETSNNAHPTSLLANDGKLWFTTPRGAVVVDPLHFAELPASPPVVIDRFSVDEQEMEAAQQLHIPAGAMRFQFEYAGLSFAAPQKVRYRYMLRGFDHGWTYAGARRTAYYTNIGPGDYQFCVQAAFAEEAFADTGGACELEPYLITPVGPGLLRQASLQFRLMPHYYQTLWFRILVLLAVLALVLVIVRRRVLRVEREFAAVMGERNRIAREIHDTLAQGYVGISLQLELLGQLMRMGKTDVAQKHLADTQNLVREGLDDARQSIWALRSQDSREQNLPIRLRRLVERARDGGLEATIHVHGAYRPLPQDVEQETLRVAQEAIQNVKKHAAAQKLQVRVEYDERSLTLTVSDDGRGFATESGRARMRGGHFGLTGMRERAALIGAKLAIVSEPGQGTTITLRVPAAGANTGDTATEADAAEISEGKQERS